MSTPPSAIQRLIAAVTNMSLASNALAVLLLVLLLRRVTNAYTTKPREGRFPVWAPLEMAFMMEVVKREGLGQHIL